jgi:hypothetical protein
VSDPASGPGAEQLAEMFHDIYERLAPEFGYTTRTDTRRFDRGSHNGKLMIAVCDQILTWFDRNDVGLCARCAAILKGDS